MEQIIMEKLEKSPQTYKTLLAGREENPTLHRVMQRYINKMIDEGKICCTSIPGRNGSRGTERLFFRIDKKYFIVISTDAKGREHYYFSRAYAMGEDFMGDYLQLENTYELKRDGWRRRGDVAIHFENVVRVI